jgi:Domain of unknown function (DUF4397)
MQIRVLHGSQGLQNISVRLDGRTILQNVTEGTISKYAETYADRHAAIRIEDARTHAVIAETNAVLTANTHYTIFVSGSAAKPELEVQDDSVGLSVCNLTSQAVTVDLYHPPNATTPSFGNSLANHGVLHISGQNIPSPTQAYLLKILPAAPEEPIAAQLDQIQGITAILRIEEGQLEMEIVHTDNSAETIQGN